MSLDELKDTLPGHSLTLGSYRLERRIARGGMGEVWRATDLRTRQAVAVKRLFLDPGHELFEQNRSRLIREAAAIRRLHHENVVRYLDAGTDDAGQPYLVLEWLEGESLEQRKRRPVPLSLALQVARETLCGLANCHARGIVHRDIKPGNLLLAPVDEGLKVKLVDFGLALLQDETTRLTHAGEVMGTLLYLSPEQARGEVEIDHRADLYAVGVVLYELTTGRLPFLADRAVALLFKIVSETPPAPGKLRPELPDWLDRLIVRAMSRNPADRFGSAEEMLTALTPPAGAAADLDAQAVLSPLADGEAVTVPPTQSTRTQEVRLVQLLCIRSAERLGDMASFIQEALERHGGVAYRLLGGQIIGVFGLHQTSGDEAQHAVEAGLEVRDLAGEGVRQLVAAVHLQVSEGLQLNAPELDRVAEKLADLPPGELVLDQVKGSARHGVPFEIKEVDGHSAVVGWATEAPARRAILGLATPTVGRETEIVAVRAAFERAEREREPEAVLVVGPPGIGKSRLLHEVGAELRPRACLWLEGGASSTRAARPYHLLGAALRRRAGILVGQADARQLAALEGFVAELVARSERDEVTRFIGAILGLPVDEVGTLLLARRDPRLMREKVVWAFEALLTAAAERGPVGLLLEDLHWADGESLQLLGLLLERMERVPLFVLATGRLPLQEQHPDLFAAVEPTRITLRPLGRRSLRKLLRAVLGQDLPTELEERVQGWCEGNPYFAEELISWMAASGTLVMEDGRWSLREAPTALDLPVSVEAVIQARLDGLAPELKELLKAAAVCGMVFWEGACVAAGQTEVEQKLRALRAAELITPRSSSRVTGTREWTFRNALAHQVAYGMLPQQPRRQLHFDVASWLEQVGEQDAALLAHHFQQAGDAARAARCYAVAGEKALADGDSEAAISYFESSLTGPVTGLPTPLLVERKLALARSQIQVSRYDEAWEQLEQLEQLAAKLDLGPIQLELLYLRGRTLYGKGDYAGAEQTLRQVAKAGQGSSDPDTVFQARQTLFWVIWAQGRYQDAGPLAEELFAEATTDGALDRLCSAKLAMAYWENVGGDLARAVTHAEEAVEHARAMGHPYREVDALMLLGVVREAVGLFDAALDALEQAKSLARRLKTVHHLAGIQSCMGRIYLTQGQHALALEYSAEAIHTAEMLEDHRQLVDALLTSARALTHAGEHQDLELAAQRAERALQLAQVHAPSAEAAARLGAVHVSLVLGEPTRAVQHARAAVELLDRLGTQERYEVEILLAAHDALLKTGSEPEARTLLMRAASSLQTAMHRISDPAVLESFSQAVPYNRRVLQLWGGAAVGVEA